MSFIKWSSPSFFFLMIRHPPRSTLFPCATLFRSLPHRALRRAPPAVRRGQVLPVLPVRRAHHARVADRSEEHTSELQSRQYLACRLLLEKKLLSPNLLVYFLLLPFPSLLTLLTAH